MLLEDSFQTAMLGTSIAFCVLTTAAVALRFYSRKVAQSPILADDYVITFVLVLCLGTCIMYAWGSVQVGYGAPLETLSLENQVAYAKIAYAHGILSNLAIGLIKVSVLLFYKRIFTMPKFLLAANTLLVASICWTIAFPVAMICRITSFKHGWVFWPPAPQHNTIDFAALTTTMSVTDLFLDIVILSLPVFVIKGLHMPRTKKVLICGIFALGTLCVVASLVRLVYVLLWMIAGSGVPLGTAENGIALWSNLEPCSSVIAACIPTYGPIFRKKSKKTPLPRFQSEDGLYPWFKTNSHGLASKGSDLSLEPLHDSSQTSRDLGLDDPVFDRVVYVKKEFSTEISSL